MSRLLLAGLVLILLFWVGCSSPSSSSPAATTSTTTASKVTEVTPLTYASLSSYPSDASPLAASAADVETLLNTITSDAEWTAISDDVGTWGSSSSTAFNNALSSFQTDLNSFTTSKSASLSSSVPAGEIGTYSQLPSPATVNASLSATTFDGNAIASDGSNLKSLSGSFLDTLDVSLIPSAVASLDSNAPPLKAGELRFNFGVDASATADQPGVFSSSVGNVTLTADYNLSLSLALAAHDSSSGLGGNIILNINSKFSNTQTYNVATTDSTTALSAFFPSSAPFSATVTVYDDNGISHFTKSWSSYSSFSSDLTSVSADASPLKAASGSALSTAKAALASALSALAKVSRR